MKISQLFKRDLPELKNENLIKARSMLLEVVKLMGMENMKYHLEGGTLLGIVRDGDLLPWDHDLDISIPFSEAEKLLRLRNKLFFRGYKVSIRTSPRNAVLFKKDQYTIFKVKKIIPSILKWIFPWYSKNCIVLDIFVKINDEKYTYWQAQGKLLRVENKFYSGYDSIEYLGHKFRIPVMHKEYLTVKYGNWRIPVKTWECSTNEGSIYAAV